MVYREIVIDWSKKHHLESVEDIAKLTVDTSNVLYMHYGDSHIYGRDVLLYIGISINAENRLKTHLKGVFGVVNNLSVSIGTVDTFPNSLDIHSDLEIPESILIANHKPSFNKEFIHDISPKAKGMKTIIINNGKNAMLKTCCTNYWWVNTISKNSLKMEIQEKISELESIKSNLN